MATTAQMISAGIALIIDTFLLIWSAFIGDKVFEPIYAWYFSFEYGTNPPIDPGIITWVPSIFFGMLICMWFGLVFALYWMSLNRVVYPYGG